MAMSALAVVHIACCVQLWVLAEEKAPQESSGDEGRGTMSVVSVGSGQLSAEEVAGLAKSAGLALSPEHVEDYRTLLGGLGSVVDSIIAQADYQPTVDYDKYPRKDIHIPQDTDKGGWATKVTAYCTAPKSDLLKGKTVALKDNMGFAGVRCTNGTKAVDWTPEIDATVATRIMDAGGTITGKATCENSCMEAVSDTSITGPVHNPYADGYSSGGSSSGSGRLVATGSVDMAIGGDQGGSIRIPASCCGIVGLKPTWGLVPYTGILSLEATIDHTGPMTRSVRDNALLLEAIAGPDGIDDRQPAFMDPGSVKYVSKLDGFLEKDGPELLKGMRIGVVEEGFWGSNTDVDDAVRKATEKFSQLGASVEKVSVPTHKLAGDLLMCGPLLAGAKPCLLSNAPGRKQLFLTDRMTVSAEKLSQKAFDSLSAGGQNLYMRHLLAEQKYGPFLHGKCSNLIRKCSDEYDKALAEFDVLVMPTLPTPPSKMLTAESTAGPLERLARTAGFISNTSPFNATGHPALTIPVAFTPAVEDRSVMLPVGLQIVGKKHSELDCFKVGGAWEKSFNWKE
ncbi:putative amidase [Neofusicoccum parvum]|nr:putative amidase [Neofusicoccum parvum]